MCNHKQYVIHSESIARKCHEPWQPNWKFGPVLPCLLQSWKLDCGLLIFANHPSKKHTWNRNESCIRRQFCDWLSDSSSLFLDSLILVYNPIMNLKYFSFWLQAMPSWFLVSWSIWKLVKNILIETLHWQYEKALQMKLMMPFQPVHNSDFCSEIRLSLV